MSSFLKKFLRLFDIFMFYDISFMIYVSLIANFNIRTIIILVEYFLVFHN